MIEPKARKERRAPETVNRLKGQENYKFLKWFETSEFEYGLSDSPIAVRATDALGFTITSGNVYGAWEFTGKTRPAIPKTDNQKMAIMKRAIELLYSEIDRPLPPEWSDL